MRIVRASLTPFRLRLRSPLETAHERVRVREGFLFALAVEDGTVGFGEAAPLAGFGLESHAVCGAALERIARCLLGRDALPIEEHLLQVEQLVPHAPAARSAADVTLHDLAARLAGTGVAELLAGNGNAPSAHIPVNALISAGRAEEVEAEARRATAAGFGTLKLKVGRDPERDVARVAAARRATGKATRIRIDANGAWSEPEARHMLERLERFDLELVEQPVPAGDLAAFARLRRSAPMRLAADESASSEAAARRVLECGCADVLVLKAPVLGGLRSARRVALEAERAGVEVLVTSLLESGLGVAAAGHLAATLPLRRHAAGLATQSLLAEDLTEPLEIRDGVLRLPSGSGLGLAPCPRRVERVAIAPPRELTV